MKDIIKLFTSAALTIVIEFVVLYILKVRDKRLRFSIFLNLCTNLALNCLLSLIPIFWLYIVLLIVGEILVFAIEWYFYNLIKKDEKNWQYSLIANISSFVIGSGIIYLFFNVIF
jgi:hypothetical protein